MRGRRWLVPALLCTLTLTACTTPAAPPDPARSTATASRAPSAAPSGTSPASPAATSTEWAARVPADTRQVVRTISRDRWCTRVHCTLTQAWVKRQGRWVLVREFRSSIGPKGWGKARKNDGRTPVGVFRIKITFSTSPSNPGRMPWRRRLQTSNVTDYEGPLYNTWVEEPWRTDGARPSMRWGFVVDYNNVRLRPGAGPAPAQDAGSGIFYHTSRPGRPWEPSEGCTRVGDPRDMRWLLTWLRPEARPRVVQNL
jgi:L,D-peptidoglycan transpeptidase YkuD (ErfK/YbiS/YcfS/YnhG family)